MSYSYGAFGKTSTKVTTYTRNNYTYNGENVDLIPGVPDLQYLRARYYDPNMGRFMQQDTLFGEMERPLTQNLYIYCLNNGVNLRDPSGNSSIAELQAQYDRAQRAGAGQSVLDEIKKAIESKRKADSKPTPKPTTKPPLKPKPPTSGGGSSGNGGIFIPEKDRVYSDSTQQLIDELEDFLSQNTNPASEALARKVAESKRQLLAAKENYFRPVLLNMPKEFCYCQYDYTAFKNKNNDGNHGCSITAVAIATSYLLGKKIEPTKEIDGKTIINFNWKNGQGMANWLPGSSVSPKDSDDTYNLLAEEISSGKPAVLLVKGHYSNTHYVTVVGVGIPSNGKYTASDFIIIDPANGEKKNLGQLKPNTKNQVIVFKDKDLENYRVGRGF